MTSIRGLYYITERSSGRKKKVIAGNVTEVTPGKGEHVDTVTNVEMKIMDYNAETRQVESKAVIVAFWNNKSAALSDWARELKIGASITVVIDDKEDGSTPRVDRLIKRNGFAPLDNGDYNLVVGYVAAPTKMRTRNNMSEYIHVGVQMPNNTWHNISFFDDDKKIYDTIIKRLTPTIDSVTQNRKYVKVAFLCGKQNEYTDSRGNQTFSYHGFQYEVLPDDLNVSGNKNKETPPQIIPKNQSASRQQTAVEKQTEIPNNNQPKPQPTQIQKFDKADETLGNTVIAIGMFRSNPTTLSAIVEEHVDKNIKWLNFVATQMPVATSDTELAELKVNIKKYLSYKGLLL